MTIGARRYSHNLGRSDTVGLRNQSHKTQPCAVAMELISQAGDTNACRDALSQARSVLDAPIFETQVAETGLESILQDVAEPWRGFNDIVIEVPQIDLPFAKQMTIEEIVEDVRLIRVNV